MANTQVSLSSYLVSGVQHVWQTAFCSSAGKKITSAISAIEGVLSKAGASRVAKSLVGRVTMVLKPLLRLSLAQVSFLVALSAFAISTYYVSTHPRYKEQPMANPFPGGKTATLSDKPKIKLFVQSQEAQQARAIKNSRAADLLNRFLDDPKEDLIFFQTLLTDRSGQYDSRNFLFPYLYECACSENGFNRFSDPRRADTEAQMIKNVEQLSPDKSKKIRYLSLGAGGALQDYINIGKLIRAGYYDIEAVLIDPVYKAPNLVVKLQKQMSFLSSVAAESHKSLKISFLDGISKAKGFFQVIQAIDFDPIKESKQDLIISHGLLSEDGRFYLMSGKEENSVNVLKQSDSLINLIE